MEDQFKNYYSTLKIIKREGYQLLLSSQAYGTNYSIFGKFTLKDNSTDILEMDFKIFNYKGILDLGFSANPNHTPDVEERGEGSDKHLFINFYVRALVAGKDKVKREITLNYTKTKPLKLHGKYVKTQRKLIPISGDLDKSPITNGVFDSEFYYRDGAKYIRRIVRDIPNDEDIPTYPVKVENIPDSLFPEANPGIICRQGTFHVKSS